MRDSTEAIASSPNFSGGYAFDYEPIPVRSSTFLAGLSQRVHRWFRLTPSFAPDLVAAMSSRLGVSEGEHVLDPFGGAATTAIEVALNGGVATSLEINPFLEFVGRVSLNWNLDVEALKDEARQLGERFNSYTHFGAEELLARGFAEPRIHNVRRWWREDVMVDILRLKAAIDGAEDSNTANFFRLALAGVLVPHLTNVTLGRLQLHFVDKSNTPIETYGTFRDHLDTMIADIAEVRSCRRSGFAKSILADSIQKDTYSTLSDIDAIITSPPYPNRYSYVWNTRPHLYLFDFIDEAKAASSLDRQTVGGTWGTATSELAKGVFDPLDADVEAVVGKLVSSIRAKDNLMANYIMHYFNRLATHLEAVRAKLAAHGRVAYVVGNSRCKGEYVETDVILAGLIEAKLGFRINAIHRFRRRHSGDRLYESIVYASR